MELEIARPLARGLLRAITPYCEQAYIAVSIRREKPEVKDIELVVVPKRAKQADPADLFGEMTVDVNALYEWAKNGIPQSSGVPKLQWIKPATRHIEPWTIGSDGKYWRGYLPDHEVKVDVFLATPDNLGAIYLIRTGSADFGQAVMTHARTIGYQFKDGWLHYKAGARLSPITTPTELSIFRALRLQYVEPEHPTGPEALKRLR